MRQIIFIALLAVAVILIGACSVEKSSTEINLPEAVSTNIKTDQTVEIKSTVMKSISELTLQEHNFKTDCWVGYDGLVYDVTRWFARETDRLEFKDRVGSIALSQSEYDKAQSILLRHCGSVVAFEEAFDRTEITLKKSRAFINPIGILD